MGRKGSKIHFIGIGGIGISALARYARFEGYSVTGSDSVYSSIVSKLEDEGISVNVPHSKDYILDQDVVVYSAIIKPSNEEVVEARRLGKVVLSRKEALLFFLRSKKVISVCAAHGKSSTTAMISSILPGFDAIIGAESKENGSNVKYGGSDYLIFEADESDSSFLNSNPYKAVVINAEAEHLENYNNEFIELKKAYYDFIDRATIPVLNVSDGVLEGFVDSFSDKPCILFDPKVDMSDLVYLIEDGLPFVQFRLKDLGVFVCYGLGEHTAINASMAILTSLEFANTDEIAANLRKFRGIRKRFDILQPASIDRPCVIDDYAHHPTEIRATLRSTKIYSELLQGHDSLLRDLSVVAVWQPHKYSRLMFNLKQFQVCFDDCDELVILPVWAAGEEKVDLDFINLFKRYKPIMANSICGLGNGSLGFLDEKGILVKTVDRGICIGLGAGDITYQLRRAVKE